MMAGNGNSEKTLRLVSLGRQAVPDNDSDKERRRESMETQG